MKKLFGFFLTVLFIAIFTISSFAAQVLLNPKFQALDDNGDPLSGGFVYTYVNGTTTDKATYTTATLAVENANPVVLDTRGEATIYLSGIYTIVLKDSDDVQIWSLDNVEGQGSTILDFVLLSEYDDIAAAVTSIGATETTLWIDEDQTMDEDVTIPATLSVVGMNGSTITTTGWTFTLNGRCKASKAMFDGTGTIAINGQFEAGDYEVFSGTSAITFATGTIDKANVRWFGAVGDGATDDYAEIVKAIASYSDIYFPYGNYRIETTLSIASNNKNLIGEVGRRPYITNAAGVALDAVVFTNAAPGTEATWGSGCSFQNFNITSSAAKQTGGAALKIIKHSGFHGTNIVVGKHKYGIQLQGVQLSHFSNLWLYGITGQTNTADSALVYLTANENTDEGPATWTKTMTTTFSDFVLGGSTYQMDYGFLIAGVDTIQATNGYINYCDQAGIRMSPNQDSTVHILNVRFTNVYCDGMSYTAGAEYGLWLQDGVGELKAVNFTNCHFDNVNTNAVVCNIEQDTEISFTGCHFGYTGSTGVTMTDGDNQELRVRFSNCEWVDCGLDETVHALYIDAADHVMLSNCSFWNTAALNNYGIILGAAGGTFNRATLTGCTFESFTQDDINISSATAFNDGFASRNHTTDTSRTVASAAALYLLPVHDFLIVSGTAAITSLTGGWAGRVVTLQFSGSAAGNGLTDGANLNLNGAANYAYDVDDAITLCCTDGTKWYEVGRSEND